MKQQFAYVFSELSPAGLTKHSDPALLFAKKPGSGLKLRGLAGAVDAFECDEQRPHGLSLFGSTRESKQACRNISTRDGRSSVAPAEPGPSVEHAHPIGRSFSWRGVVLALALLLVIALAALGGRALLHRLDGTRPVSDTGQVQKGQGSVAAAVRPRSATSVLVLNGNGLSGAAGGLASRLLAHGYRSALATDAQVTTYSRSFVLFRPGWAREAERLAKDAGIRTVAPLDGTLPVTEPRYPLVAIVGH